MQREMSTSAILEEIKLTDLVFTPM
jgi:hypothetical protein